MTRAELDKILNRHNIEIKQEWRDMPAKSLEECEEYWRREADKAEARARSAEELADKIEDLAKRATHLVTYLENKYSRKKA